MASVREARVNGIEITVPCRSEYVRTVRRAVAEFAVLNHVPRMDVEEVEVAASEAVANVIRHAYSGRDHRPPVRIRCWVRDGGLTVEIADKGRGFHAPPDHIVPEIDHDRDGGMGIILMKTLMDRVNLVSRPEVGTRIRMTKHVRRPAQPLSSDKSHKPRG